MGGRPEGSDFGGYNSEDFESYDGEAWQEFTPFRPGDASMAERPSAETAASGWAGFKWTEDQPESYDVGDRVQNVRRVGGVLGGAVPEHTIGEVVSTRSGMFDDYVTVRFDNGYTEEVAPEDIEHKGWF